MKNLFSFKGVLVLLIIGGFFFFNSKPTTHQTQNANDTVVSKTSTTPAPSTSVKENSSSNEEKTNSDVKKTTPDSKKSAQYDAIKDKVTQGQMGNQSQAYRLNGFNEGMYVDANGNVVDNYKATVIDSASDAIDDVKDHVKNEVNSKFKN